MGSVTAGTRALVWDRSCQPTAASISADVARGWRSRDAGLVRGRQHTPTPELLSGVVLAFRVFHATIAVEQLLSIGYVWWCALSGRRGRLLRIAAATLLSEGVLVTANGGDCPLGGLQERLDDPVPLFELVLSPRAAKWAVPTLGAITVAGLALLVARGSPRWSLSRSPVDLQRPPQPELGVGEHLSLVATSFGSGSGRFEPG